LTVIRVTHVQKAKQWDAGRIPWVLKFVSFNHIKDNECEED
jgi:hypothetical protein